MRTQRQLHPRERATRSGWTICRPKSRYTIPDLAAAARMLNLPNASDVEVREALGQGFPKHPLHKIACIGALVASRQPEGWQVDALGASGRKLAHERLKAL